MATANINIEDRDRLVKTFSEIEIADYDHNISAEYALFTRLLKLKAVRENYNIDAFDDILAYYKDNGLSFNKDLSGKKDISAKIYSFLTYAFSHPEKAKNPQNTMRWQKREKSNNVIEAQTAQESEYALKNIKDNILADMKNSIEKGYDISRYTDEDINNNGIGCSKCISGYIQRPDKTWTFCECYLRERTRTKYRKSGIPESYLKYNNINDDLVELCAVKNYSNGTESFKGILLSKYIDNYKGNIKKLITEGWNLIIEGPPGTLKTTTACILGKHAIDCGYDVVFTEMQQLRKLWTGEKLSPELETYKKKIYEVDLLILDDFGQEFMSGNSDYQMAELDYLLRSRLSENKIFIITTNATKEQIENRYSNRIVSLLNKNMMHLFIKTHRDLRENEGLPDIF